MATFTDKQISDLNAASARIAAGTNSPLDKTNVNYAIKKGYIYSPATPTTTPTATPTTTPTDTTTPMTVLTPDQIQEQTNTAFSGMVSPMSIDEIRAQQAKSEAASAQTAEATYNPQIATETTSGARAVGAAEGQAAGAGAGAGSGAGSAQIAFLASVQQNVNDRIAAIQKEKEAAINQGQVNAANIAQASIDKLNEYNNNLLIAKANYAISLMGQNLQAAQFNEQVKTNEQNYEIAKSNLAINLANLTGKMADGSPTYQAQQDKINNALKEADIRGYYKGEKTLARMIADADIELRKEGIAIDKSQLAESIRHNKASEGIEAANAAAAKLRAGATMTEQEKALQADLQKSNYAVAQDPTKWGPEWSYIKNTYFPDLPTDTPQEKLAKAHEVDLLMQKDIVTARQNQGASSTSIFSDLSKGFTSVWDSFKGGFGLNK